MQKISDHISFNEAIRSNTATSQGISNQPEDQQLKAMTNLAENVFEPIRVHFDKPIKINSFFRSVALNTAIGGSASSQHCKGEAMDLDGTGGLTNAQIFAYIKDSLDFDQLIWEFGTDDEPAWVHVSLKLTGSNRKQILKAVKISGRTKYLPFSGPVSIGENQGVVTASALNIRSSASSGAATVADKLPRDTIVTIIETIDGWLKVDTPNGIQGWVSADYVKRS